MDHQAILRADVAVKGDHVHADLQPFVDQPHFVIFQHGDEAGQFGGLLLEVKHQVLKAPQEIEAVKEAFAVAAHQKPLPSFLFNVLLDFFPISWLPFRLPQGVRHRVSSQRAPIRQRVLYDLAFQPFLHVVPEAAPVVPIVFSLPIDRWHLIIEVRVALLISGEYPGMGQDDLLQVFAIDFPGQR
mgnify:CR=1 FL=1